jgi:hypothetical protein
VELLRVHLDDPEPPDMLVGLQLALSPVVGLTEGEIVTVFVKPFWPLIEAVNEPVAPEPNDRLDGFVETVKSGLDWCKRHPVRGCISQPL